MAYISSSFSIKMPNQWTFFFYYIVVILTRTPVWITGCETIEVSLLLDALRAAGKKRQLSYSLFSCKYMDKEMSLLARWAKYTLMTENMLFCRCHIIWHDMEEWIAIIKIIFFASRWDEALCRRRAPLIDKLVAKFKNYSSELSQLAVRVKISNTWQKQWRAQSFWWGILSNGVQTSQNFKKKKCPL